MEIPIIHTLQARGIIREFVARSCTCKYSRVLLLFHLLNIPYYFRHGEKCHPVYYEISRYAMY